MSFIDRIREQYRKTRNAHDTEPEKVRLDDLSRQLGELSETLAQDVEANAAGEHGMPDTQLRYTLLDYEGEVLLSDSEDRDYVTARDIKATDGFALLKAKCRELGLQIDLHSEAATTYEDRDRTRFEIVVSGWA